MTDNVNVLRYVVGPVCTNCYLLVNDNTKELIVVDPGEQADMLIRQIDKTGAEPVAILLTHGHFDHATAAEEISRHYDIKIYAHEAEQETRKSKTESKRHGRRAACISCRLLC